MEKVSGEQPARLPASIDKTARRQRIFARMRAGRAYDEIAREERVTARRVRRIVAEGLKTRDAEPAQALRVAGALVVAGELRAIGPLMKRLDEAQRRLRRSPAKVAQSGA